jgi:hypothetical protein
MLGQHYHTKIDHLEIGTEKIVSSFENKKNHYIENIRPYTKINT